MAVAAANVRSKSVYDPPDASDGRRVLVTQYWPRGVPKAAVDEYARALAPSRPLLHAFKGAELDWESFGRRYAEEMRAPEAQAEIERLANLAAEAPLTLLCVCREESRCHRSLLRALIASIETTPDI